MCWLGHDLLINHSLRTDTMESSPGPSQATHLPRCTTGHPSYSERVASTPLPPAKALCCHSRSSFPLHLCVIWSLGLKWSLECLCHENVMLDDRGKAEAEYWLGLKQAMGNNNCRRGDEVGHVGPNLPKLAPAWEYPARKCTTDGSHRRTGRQVVGCGIPGNLTYLPVPFLGPQ